MSRLPFYTVELKTPEISGMNMPNNGPGLYFIKAPHHSNPGDNLHLAFWDGNSESWPFLLQHWDLVSEEIKKFFENPEVEEIQEAETKSDRMDVSEDFVLKLIAVSKANGSNFKLSEILN